MSKSNSRGENFVSFPRYPRLGSGFQIGIAFQVRVRGIGSNFCHPRVGFAGILANIHINFQL